MNDGDVNGQRSPLAINANHVSILFTVACRDTSSRVRVSRGRRVVDGDF